MKCSIAALTMMALLASIDPVGRAQQPERPPDPAPDGQALVRQAARQVSLQSAMQAQLRQQVDLFGQRLVGSGSYLQKRSPRGTLLRFEVKLGAGDRASSLQQICDGRFLWVRRAMPQGTVLGRADLDRIREAADRSQPRPLADPATNWMLLGGLPGLLDGLARHFDFGPPQPSEAARVPAWRLEGAWKQTELTKMLPDQKEAILAGGPVDLDRLPTHLPTRVVLLLRRQDLMPCRIEYVRQAQAAPADQPGAEKTEPKTLVVLELSDIRCDVDLPDGQFVCQPTDQQVADYTSLYLQTLQLQQSPPER